MADDDEDDATNLYEENPKDEVPVFEDCPFSLSDSEPVHSELAPTEICDGNIEDSPMVITSSDDDAPSVSSAACTKSHGRLRLRRKTPMVENVPAVVRECVHRAAEALDGLGVFDHMQVKKDRRDNERKKKAEAAAKRLNKGSSKTLMKKPVKFCKVSKKFKYSRELKPSVTKEVKDVPDVFKNWHAASGEDEWRDDANVKIKRWVERDRAMVQIRYEGKCVIGFTCALMGAHSDLLIEEMRRMYVRGFSASQLAKFKCQVLLSIRASQ